MSSSNSTTDLNSILLFQSLNLTPLILQTPRQANLCGLTRNPRLTVVYHFRYHTSRTFCQSINHDQQDCRPKHSNWKRSTSYLLLHSMFSDDHLVYITRSLYMSIWYANSVRFFCILLRQSIASWAHILWVDRRTTVCVCRLLSQWRKQTLTCPQTREPRPRKIHHSHCSMVNGDV